MPQLNSVVLSGGGTGGHIYPAIAVAQEIRQRYPDCTLLFIGAKGRMEMEKVPAAGFEIIGLDIRGFQRKALHKNLLLPIKLLSSLLQARRIMKKWKPDVVIGFGGYASGPTLKMAQWLKIPTVIQEQNSYPGKTNLILAKKANAFCVAYDHMDRFFPASRIYQTGNPIRSIIQSTNIPADELKKKWGLNPELTTLFVFGGSLGAKVLNDSMFEGLEAFQKQRIQLIWQCGKTHFQSLKEKLTNLDFPNVKLLDFIENMDEVYEMADLIVARAGALSISELCLVAKPVILVPSPYVAEDHQNKNAMALVEKGAAIRISESEARQKLVASILQLSKQPDHQKQLSEAIKKIAMPHATSSIVDVIEKVSHG